MESGGGGAGRRGGRGRPRARLYAHLAQAENFLRGNPDLDDTIARLQAYEGAGADVLYAPRLTRAEEVKAICDALGAGQRARPPE